MPQDKGRASACYLAGILRSQYNAGNLSESMKENINEQLERDDLEHVKIE